MKEVVELQINDDENESGVWAIALVEQPAISVDFYAFNDDTEMVDGIVDILVKIKDPENRREVLDDVLKDLENEGIDTEGLIQRVMGEEFETYNDYPKAASENACSALRWAEENGWGDCGTPVGKIRANQLCKGENISRETISRMASFARHRENGQRELGDGCGRLMWQSWGGDEGVDWAIRKLETLKAEKEVFVKPRAGEKEDEFIPRCMSVLIGDEGYDEKQAAAICYTYWEEKMGVDVSGLAPYIQNIKGKNKKRRYEAQELVLGFCKEFGYTEKDLEKFANASLGGGINSVEQMPLWVRDPRVQTTLYKYEGGLRSNSRDFCIEMVGLNKFYTFDMIEAMENLVVNAGFGARGADTYSIWRYLGGKNCYHFWRRYTYVWKGENFELLSEARVKGLPGTRMIDRPRGGGLKMSYEMFYDEEQKVLVGPVMVPDIEIPRKDENDEVYYVYFTPETIKSIRDKFMKTQTNHATNQDHDETKPADTYIIETWIKEDDEDKSKKYGFGELPVGTWFCMMKVLSDEVWKRIKEKELNGFSVEGHFIKK